MSDRKSSSEAELLFREQSCSVTQAGLESLSLSSDAPALASQVAGITSSHTIPDTLTCWCFKDIMNQTTDLVSLFALMAVELVVKILVISTVSYIPHIKLPWLFFSLLQGSMFSLFF